MIAASAWAPYFMPGSYLLSSGGATRFGSAKSLNSRERAKAFATNCADST